MIKRISVLFLVYLVFGGYGDGYLTSAESLVENESAWITTYNSIKHDQCYFPTVIWQNNIYYFGL